MDSTEYSNETETILPHVSDEAFHMLGHSLANDLIDLSEWN